MARYHVEAVPTAVFNLSVQRLESIQWSSEEVRHGLKLCQANFIITHTAGVRIEHQKLMGHYVHLCTH